MADKDFTAQNNATPEQLAEQFPCNAEPFGVWYNPDAESHYTWAINDENGDGFNSAMHYKTALILSDALKIRHQKINNKEVILDIEQQKEINHALLIGLDSFGEIERISNEVGIEDLCPSSGRIPDSIRPIHPTGSADTISIFATALRYLHQN